MNMQLSAPGNFSLLYMTGLMAFLLFFSAVLVSFLLIRQKHFLRLGLSLPILVTAYFLWQCIALGQSTGAHSQLGKAVLTRFTMLSPGFLLSLCFACAAVLFLLFQDILHFERNTITAMSVKEAVDILPDGVCCYVPGGRILLINRSMQAFSLAAAGELLLNGDIFYRKMLSGDLQADCKKIDFEEESVYLLADGTAWRIIMEEIPFEKYQANLMVVSEVTKTFHKTEKLRAMQQKVTELGAYLTRINKEIVELTTEREMLNAKVKLHDEMGGNLLAIKRYCLSGGTREELEKITQKLRSNIAFLKTDPAAERDEYELLAEISDRMGLAISVTGDLPQMEPCKHMIALAIHECATNTLRHAHGDLLRIGVTEDSEKYTAEFSNNGDLPEGPIEEKGGLSSLRTMIETMGGVMEIHTSPYFSIRLELPKGVQNAL